MKRIIATLVVIQALTGCGIDGEPERPTVHGTVTMSDSGLSAGAGVRLGHGPFTLGLGLGL
jgi:hypothetical protein